MHVYDIPHRRHGFSYTRFPDDNGLAKKDHVWLELDIKKTYIHTRKSYEKKKYITWKR